MKLDDDLEKCVNNTIAKKNEFILIVPAIRWRNPVC